MAKKEFNAQVQHLEKLLTHERQMNNRLRESVSDAYQERDTIKVQLLKANKEKDCLCAMLSSLIDMTHVTEEQIREKMRHDDTMRRAISWILRNCTETYDFFDMFTQEYQPGGAHPDVAFTSEEINSLKFTGANPPSHAPDMKTIVAAIDAYDSWRDEKAIKDAFNESMDAFRETHAIKPYDINKDIEDDPSLTLALNG